MIQGQVKEERFAWQSLVVRWHWGQGDLLCGSYWGKLIHALRERLEGEKEGERGGERWGERKSKE